jgi:hypothetical protein
VEVEERRGNVRLRQRSIQQVGRQRQRQKKRQTDGKSMVECAFAGCDCHQAGSGWAVFAL